MKAIILFLSFFVLTLCTPPPKREIAVTDTFIPIRKNLLQCIVNSPKVSEEMKKYATDFLKTDLSGDLNLGQFRENKADYNIIKKCRREAFYDKSKRKHNKGKK